MTGIQIGGVFYGFSERAFALRAIAIVSSRGWTSPAQAAAGVSNLAFTSGGWLQQKRVLAELVLGSIIWPSDFDPAFPSTPILLPGLTEDIIGTRDVSSVITAQVAAPIVRAALAENLEPVAVEAPSVGGGPVTLARVVAAPTATPRARWWTRWFRRWFGAR